MVLCLRIVDCGDAVNPMPAALKGQGVPFASPSIAFSYPVCCVRSCITAGNRVGVLPSAMRATRGPRPRRSHDLSRLLGSYLAGRVASRTMNFEAAAEYYRRALARDPDNRHARRSLQDGVRRGNMREAVVWRAPERSGGSEHGFAYLLLRHRCLQARRLRQAENLFPHGWRQPDHPADGRLALAWTQFVAERRRRPRNAVDAAKCRPLPLFPSFTHGPGIGPRRASGRGARELRTARFSVTRQSPADRSLCPSCRGRGTMPW